MNAINSPDLLASAVSCPKCQRQAVISSVLSKGKKRLLIFECECSAIIVLGVAFSVDFGRAGNEAGKEDIPLMILSDGAAKIVIPQVGVSFSPKLRS